MWPDGSGPEPRALIITVVCHLAFGDVHVKWQALECATDVTWEAEDPSSIPLGRDMVPHQPLSDPSLVAAPGPAGTEAQASEDYISQDACWPRAEPALQERT